ncbi:hypothetical protein HYU13_03425 [Candidatus Woesearchaeota archaeon]|nr:hypothetical protein [Candidatus Woesearchaeota archaeon]
MPLKFNEEMENYLALRKRRLFLKNLSAGIWARAIASTHKLSSKASGYANAIKNTFDRRHSQHASGLSPLHGGSNPSLEHVIEEKIAEGNAVMPIGHPKEKVSTAPAQQKAVKPKKSLGSFLKTISSFVSVRTVTEIEEERKKAEEEQAVKEYLEVKQMMGHSDSQQETDGAIAIAGSGDESLSSYFPSNISAGTGKIREEADEVIELDKGYRIRVIKNR